MKILYKKLCQKFVVQRVRYGLKPQMFVNMVVTAVFFEAKAGSTAHHVDLDTILVHCSEINTRRLTECVSVCHDGTKLPLFVIFNGEQNGRMEKTLTQSYQVEWMGAVSRKAEWIKQLLIYG